MITLVCQMNQDLLLIICYLSGNPNKYIELLGDKTVNSILEETYGLRT